MSKTKKDPRRTEGDSLPNIGSKWKEKKNKILFINLAS